MYITNSKGVLFAIRIKDGAELWRFDAQEEINSHVFLEEDILFFTCKDSTCYAIERSSGKLLWKRHQRLFHETKSYWCVSCIHKHGWDDWVLRKHVRTLPICGSNNRQATMGVPLFIEIQPYIRSFLAENRGRKNEPYKWPSWRIKLFRQPFSVQNTVVLVFWTDYQVNVNSLWIHFQKRTVEKRMDSFLFPPLTTIS